MINVKNKSLLDKYDNNTGISKLFSQDITNLLELFSLNKGDFLIIFFLCVILIKRSKENGR